MIKLKNKTFNLAPHGRGENSMLFKADHNIQLRNQKSSNNALREDYEI